MKLPDEIVYGNVKDKDVYLFTLYNLFNAKDLRVFYDFIGSEGEICFSKWIRYDELMTYDWNTWETSLKMSRAKFTEKISHRTILNIEIVIDLDDVVPLFDTMLDHALWATDKLFKAGFEPKMYHTGNKGYHIHYLDPALIGMSNHDTEKYKEQAILNYGGEAGKAKSNAPIMFEGALHRKTQQPKKRIV